MTLTHLHLLLNHVPVLGTAVGLVLLAFAMWRKSEDIKKAALGVFVVVALVALPTFFTGEPAEDVVEPLPGVSKPMIERHEKAATVALVGMSVLGVAALSALVLFRQARIVPAVFGYSILAAALVVTGLMAWTANLGGQIRHTEIRPNAVSAAIVEVVQQGLGHLPFL